MKPGPKSFRRSELELCMNDLEPDDIPLNFSYMRDREGKEREREGER
jgi:hypothetical protein